MPRIARKFLDTSFFHVIVQGIKKEYIFKKDCYKEQYIYLMNKYKEKHDIEIIAYCVMDNHVHLLIYSNEINNLSNYMHKVNSIYAQYYNKQEHRVGYVYRNRYVSEAITNEHYLIRCIDYIHKNPVKAKRVKKCENYKYSSYEQYIKNIGIATSKIITEVIGKCNYKELFDGLYNDEYFYDVDVDRKEVLEKAICKFCKEKKNSLEEIMKDDYSFKELIEMLKDKNKITYIEMMERFQVSRSKMEKLKLKGRP